MLTCYLETRIHLYLNERPVAPPEPIGVEALWPSHCSRSRSLFHSYSRLTPVLAFILPLYPSHSYSSLTICTLSLFVFLFLSPP